MNHDFGHEEYAGRRLRSWLDYMMEERDISNEELAESLGYERSSIVKLWREGKSDVPWRALPKLAKMMGVDPAILISLFIDQDHANDPELREFLFKVSCRIVSAWEFPLCELARDIYIANDEYIWSYSPETFIPYDDEDISDD